MVRYKHLGKSLGMDENLFNLSFPRLFALEENKDISVADKMNTSNLPLLFIVMSEEVSNLPRRRFRRFLSLACPLCDHVLEDSYIYSSVCQCEKDTSEVNFVDGGNFGCFILNGVVTKIGFSCSNPNPFEVLRRKRC
ncbi:hypothetical protein Tco_0137860 [Tanacetum coccineum]